MQSNRRFCKIVLQIFTMKNWDDFRYFVAVERAGSMLGAARLLGVNTATVSRHLDRLETALGKQLFYRNTTGYVLSEEGERLLPHARSVEAKIFNIARLVDRDQEIDGTVTITLTEALAAPFLIPALPEFRRQYPRISIDMIRDDRSLNLNRREADIGLRLVRPKQGGLKVLKIAELRFGLYASSTYLRRSGTPKELADLAGRDTIGWVDEFANLGPVSWWNDKVQQPAVYRSNSPTCRETATACGLGIALLPRIMADCNPLLELILPSENIPTLDVWLVVHKDLSRAPRVRALFDFIKAQSAKHRF